MEKCGSTPRRGQMSRCCKNAARNLSGRKRASSRAVTRGSGGSRRSRTSRVARSIGVAEEKARAASPRRGKKYSRESLPMFPVNGPRNSRNENRRRRVASHAVDDTLWPVKIIAWRGRRASSPVTADSASGLSRQPRTAVCGDSRDGCLPMGLFPRHSCTGARRRRVKPAHGPHFFHFLSCLENQGRLVDETSDFHRYFGAISTSHFYKKIGPTAKYCAQLCELLLTCLSVVDTPIALRVMISHTSARSPEQISQSRHCGQKGGVK